MVLRQYQSFSFTMYNILLRGENYQCSCSCSIVAHKIKGPTTIKKSIWYNSLILKLDINKSILSTYLLLINILPESIVLLLCMINDEFTASSMIPVHVYSSAADSLRSSK